MNYFTLIRHSGFGDYAGTVKKICFLLGPEYEFVVVNDYKYKNYHCPDLDFLNLFYTGKYLNSDNIKFVCLEEALKNKPEHGQIYAIKLNDHDFSRVVKTKLITNEYIANIFKYKPKSNPFGQKSNKAVLHIRTNDVLIKKIRKVVNPSKIKNFIENFAKQKNQKINMIICSDLNIKKTQHKLSYVTHSLLESIYFNENINILEKIIGTEADKTIKTMDSFFYSDFVFSKSSCFCHLFNRPLITIPDECCFL